MRPSRAALFGLGPLLFVAARGSAETFYGTGIASLSFRGDAPVDEKRLAALTDLAPGRTLTGEAVRTSLRNLFATRLFSDLALEASTSPAGTIVVVVFSAAPRIERLTISSGVPASGRILDAIGLGPGNPWQSDLKPRYEADIRRVLREEGYFDPKIATRVEAGADETSVDVRFDVEKGPRAVAGAPRFSAPLGPIDEATLLARAKSKRGKPYRGAAAREDAERFAALYRKAGYSRAEVRLDDESYDAASTIVTPHYALFVGPRVVLKVTGEREKVVRAHPDSPWTRGEPSDEDSLQLLKDGLRRTYQEKGYARAKVDVTFETTVDEELVAFTIDKGERWTISSVKVTGAASLRRKDVLGAIQMRPRGFLGPGRYVDGDAAADRDTLEGLYRTEGYRYARVSPPSATEGASRDTLDVTFKVEEGFRTIVATRTVKGIKTVPEDVLLPKLAVKAGLPYSESSVSDDAALLQSLYVDRGYVDARVESSARFLDPVPPEGERAEVTYSVTEGTPVTFGKTILRGNRRTQPFIVEDRLANKEGSPFSLTKLLETQQNLARLGIFQKIEVTTFGTDPETNSRAVVVTVSEARPWSITYGIGAEYQPQAPGHRPLGAPFARLVVQQPLRARPRGERGRAHLESRPADHPVRARPVAVRRPRSGFRGRVPDERLLLGHSREANGSLPSGGVSAVDFAAHGPSLPVRARGSELRPRARRGPAREPAEPHQLDRGRGDLGPARRPPEPALGHVPRRGRQVRFPLPDGGRGLRQVSSPGGALSPLRDDAARLLGSRRHHLEPPGVSSGAAGGRDVLSESHRACPGAVVRGRFVHPSRLSARQSRHPGGDPEHRRRGRGRHGASSSRMPSGASRSRAGSRRRSFSTSARSGPIRTT